jgi:TolB-like protein/class 3 adenylate cyclase
VEQEVGGSSPPNCTSATECPSPRILLVRCAVDPVSPDIQNLASRTAWIGVALAEPIEVKRRLAAIFAADVEGYSRLMGADEVATLDTLTARREILDGLIATHGGRIANTAGDSVLAEFGSAVDAVRCATEAQDALAKANSTLPEKRHINFRIGVHVGDVMVRAGDLFGDGVNIAARLQTLARAGGLCISGVTYDQVRKILPLAFTDLGAQTVKNIEEPIRAYEVKAQGEAASSALKDASSLGDRKPLPLPDRPSIAVLPFQNMSGDPEQEYFADGMVEDIITALSRFKSLFVIARNSSFTYKGKAVDIKQVGRELGVRYVLEGSVRKSGARLRITGQLIDAATGAHLWADKFEGNLLDVFDLQDSIATSVVGAITPRLIAADAELARRKPPESWDSYDFYLRGIALFVKRTPDTTDKALEFLRKAISLNPEFALAHIRAAACLFMRPEHGGLSLTDEERSEALQLTNCALALDEDSEWVLGWASVIFVVLNGEVERGSDLVDRALAINPNFSSAWNGRGWISTILGDGARALDAFDRAARLNPADDWTVVGATQGKMAALWVMDRYSDALELADRVLARRPNDLRGWFMKHTAEPDPYKATDAGDRIRALYPHLRNSDLRRVFYMKSTKHRAMVDESIARLGLPE